MVIFVSPLSAVDTVIEAHRPARVVSLLNPHEMIDTPAGISPEHHLRLGMADIATPSPGLQPPAKQHVEQLLSFVHAWNGNGSMLVHCWAGVSRSTAAAFITLCALNEGASEAGLASYLRAQASHASPNRLLVAHADALLKRDGRMIDAVEKMGPSSMVWEGTIFNLSTRVSDGGEMDIR